MRHCRRVYRSAAMRGNGGRQQCSPNMSPKRESTPAWRGTSLACGHSRRQDLPRVCYQRAVPNTRWSTQWTCSADAKKKFPDGKKEKAGQSINGDEERMKREGGLCVFPETLFGKNVRVREPRKDHVEWLAEERRCELRSAWRICHISFGSCV